MLRKDQVSNGVINDVIKHNEIMNQNDKNDNVERFVCKDWMLKI